jgi:hypothetical protein
MNHTFLVYTLVVVTRDTVNPLASEQGTSPPKKPDLDRCKDRAKQKRQSQHDQQRSEWEDNTMSKYRGLSRADKRIFLSLAAAGDSSI